jgi:hypothetical protein
LLLAATNHAAAEHCAVRCGGNSRQCLSESRVRGFVNFPHGKFTNVRRSLDKTDKPPTERKDRAESVHAVGFPSSKHETTRRESGQIAMRCSIRIVSSLLPMSRSML